MRIIRGKYGGRIIHPPNNLKVRPTTDLAREALFSILETQFSPEGRTVLDLFSGTGSISYEFASRGAASIDMVEQNMLNFRFILKTIGDLQMTNIRVYRRDVYTFLKKCKQQYDLIFADPPFRDQKTLHLPELILRSSILLPGGWFILEHPEKYSFHHFPEFFTERKYSQIHFSFFTNREETEQGKKE